MYSEGSGNGSILAKSKARALLCRTMCVSYIRIHKYSLNITGKKYCFGKKFLECFLVIFREYVVIIFLFNLSTFLGKLCKVFIYNDLVFMSDH